MLLFSAACVSLLPASVMQAVMQAQSSTKSTIAGDTDEEINGLKEVELEEFAFEDPAIASKG